MCSVVLLLSNLELTTISRRGVRISHMATTTTNSTARTRATAGKKAAATRKRNAAKRSQSARKAAATRAEAERTYVEALALQAERAVLIPVGAALVARDTVLETAKGF